LGQMGNIIGCKDYYVKVSRSLCTCAFSTSASTTTINNGEFAPGITKLDEFMGHNCKMPKALYKAICKTVLGLPTKFWAACQTEMAFHNLILQEINAMMCCYDPDCYDTSKGPFLNRATKLTWPGYLHNSPY
jgi:hypothetical protein